MEVLHILKKGHGIALKSTQKAAKLQILDNKQALGRPINITSTVGNMSKLSIFNHSKEPWYQEGLRFKCTGCGKCCTGAPGFVFLTDADVEKLLHHLKISKQEFVERYTKSFNDRLSLRDDTPNYGCIFLKEGKYCQVYQARPMQCKTYPYWLGNISSKAQWIEESERCEGINHPDAPLISKEEIEKNAALHAGLIEEEP